MNINDLLPNPADAELKATIRNALVDKSLNFEDQELNLDTITNSRELSELGALAGDKIVDGKLVRVWSEPEDSVNFGHVVTESDIFWNQELRDLGAKVGDRIVNGELYDSKADELMTQFKYGWESTDSLTGMGIDIINAAFPVDADPAEYGEEFENAAYDRRVELINLRNQRKLQEQFDPYTLHQLETQGAGGAGIVGSIFAGLADPLALTPIGRTVKAGMAIGGAYGGAYSLAEDISKGKEIDMSKFLMSSGIGGAFGGGANKVTNMLKQRFSDKQAQAADDFLDKVESEIETKIAAGVSPKVAKKEVYDEVGVNKIQTAQVISERSGNAKLNKKKESSKKLTDTIMENSTVARTVVKGLDKYLNLLSTNIKKIDETTFGFMRKFEAASMRKTSIREQAVKPWISEFNKLDKGLQKQIGLLLSNNQRKEALGLMPNSLKNEFTKVKNVLDTMDKEFKKVGHKYASLKDYFPRQIKDFEGLNKALNKAEKDGIDKALDVVAKRSGRVVNDLTDKERSEVIDMYLRGFTPKRGKGKKLTYVQERKIRQLDDELYQYYENPMVTLKNYVDKGTHDIEKFKAFGKYAVKDDAGLDNIKSIGKYVDEARANLDKKQKNDLTELLRARFIGEANAPSGLAAGLRDLGYMGTLPNPLSALVQLGDLAVSGGLNGLKSTISGIFGKKYVKLVDIGFDSVLSAEVTNTRKLAGLLDTMFKVSGFKAVDRLGKETLMNAALHRVMNKVKTPKGEAAFRNQWKKIYGDELDSMVISLKKGKADENVMLHAFNELSDMQPISLLEMPQGYLEAKNGRLLYMLKTFTLKQWDIVRRNVIQEFAKGNKAKAIRNMVVLGAYLTAANTGVQFVKDFLQGREVKPEDIPSRSMWALLGVYGVNQYTAERYFQRGDVTGFALNFLTPATPIIDAMFGATADAAKQLSDMQSRPDWSDKAPNYGKYIKPLPVVGNLYYQWFLGGKELWNQREESRRRRERRER